MNEIDRKKIDEEMKACFETIKDIKRNSDEKERHKEEGKVNFTFYIV